MEETLPDPLGGNNGPGHWQGAEGVGEWGSANPDDAPSEEEPGREEQSSPTFDLQCSVSLVPTEE